MSEWIEWHGGEQPVADDVVVEIEDRLGCISKGEATTFIWDDLNSLKDIIAYRIVSQPSELDRLRKENAELREALRICVDVICLAGWRDDYSVKNARAALQGAKDSAAQEGDK